MAPTADLAAGRRPVVVAAPSPREFVQQFTRALERDDPVAVLHPGWPATLAVSAARRARHARVSPADLVLFTSGSGGVPRAVHRSRESWLASADAFTDILGLESGDVTWVAGHPASTAPLYAAWHAHLLGLPVRYHDEPRAEASVAHAPPTLVPGLLRDRAEGKLPRLRLVVTAGDRVPHELRSRCAAVGVRLVAYYGAAELSFVAVRDDDRAGYRAFPGVEVDIRDGLLWSRSPYQAYGYLQPGEPSPGESEQPGRPSPADHPGPLRRDADGWACVGDRARWLDTGRLVVLGRADQAVTVSGHTVLVEDVEAALRRAPGVREVVVVGLPDEVHGQRVVALWTGDPDAPLEAATADLPSPARPRGRHHLRDLPLTASGKPDRAQAAMVARAMAQQRRGSGT